MRRRPNPEKLLKVSKTDLQIAVNRGLISSDQMKNLWESFAASNIVSKHSKMLQFFYYLGAMLVISSMTWFMTLGWNWFGGGGLFLIALCYAIIFFASGYRLWQKPKFKIPGGLLATVAICMTPLAIFGLEKYTGVWLSGDPGEYTDFYKWIKGSWLFMEIGTILIGLIALRFVHFPFMTVPIAASFWLMSMDITPLFFAREHFTWEQQCWVSIVFGLTLLISSYFTDKKSKKDFAFWGYLFGTLTFWVGLSVLSWSSELNWLFYFFINLSMMVCSIFLGRNVLMIFGTLGVFEFLSHLAYEVFKNSILFPFALSFIGIIVIVIGILFQKNYSLIKTSIVTALLALSKYLKRNASGNYLK